MMKKLVLMLSVLVLVASCGSTKKDVYGSAVVKDKDGVVLGYFDRTSLLVQLLSLTDETNALNGYWASLDLDTGKIDWTGGNNDFYFSGADCTGTAYYFSGADFMKNLIVKPYPYLSGTATTASQVWYKESTPATLTSTVKSFLTIDVTPTTNYYYDPNDRNTWRFKCDLMATSLIVAGTCKDASGNLLCNETVESGAACQNFCVAPLVWAATGDNTVLPLSDDTYNNGWSVLEAFTTAPTEWTAVAPLYMDVYDNQ